MAAKTVLEEPEKPPRPLVVESLKRKTWKMRTITKREKQYDWNKNGVIDWDELAALRQNKAQDRMIKDLRRYEEGVYEGLVFPESP